MNSATQITAVSPAGSGTVDVKVTTPGGTSATSTADRFTYLVAPTVTGISPTSGPAAGGTTVIITGRDFTGASKVLFGRVAASRFTVNSATQITAVSPAGSGTVDVRVTTPGGTSATSNADRFTYVSAPTDNGRFAHVRTSRGRDDCHDHRERFHWSQQGAVREQYPPAALRVNSDTQITAVSPAGSGTVDVRVTTPGGTSATSTADRFTYVFAQPMITGISPTSGPAAGGTSVTITGSHFTGASKVLFGTVAASSVT